MPKRLLANESGQTLIELMITNIVTVIVLLGSVTALLMIQNHYAALVDQNDAQQALVEATYYLKLFGQQAAKVKCSPITPIVAGFAGGATLAEEPNGVDQGYFHCDTAGTYTADTATPLAIFHREDGRALAGGTATSNYQGTGIYFAPPNTSRAGELLFATAPPGGVLNSATALVKIDHLVSVKVESQLSAPSGYMQAITYKVVARYFTGKIGLKDYSPVPAGFTAAYQDIDSIVTVSFRNNRIGISALDNISSERAGGMVYYYKPVIPTLGAF